MMCCVKHVEEDKNEEPINKSKKKNSKRTALLICVLSCCMFWFVLCAVFVSVLVFIGRQILLHETFSSRKTELSQVTFLNYKRLPNDTLPIAYNLTILPFLLSSQISSTYFVGAVNISLQIFTSKKNIMLHNKNLNISEVQLMDKYENNFQVTAVIQHPENEILVLALKDHIPSGHYFLMLKFHGLLNNVLTGIYESTYLDGKIKRKIAATKFQPTYARQAFPCFDEPNFKARFSIAVLKPINSTAISNYPVARITPYDSSYELVTFQETLPMSTYLICFVLSNFVYNETIFQNDGKNALINQLYTMLIAGEPGRLRADTETPLRLYATTENLPKTEYASDFAKKVMEYYVGYFGIKYPLPKLDMAAIPDYVSGATEHWGIVTYRETSLFYTEKTHSTLNKERVAMVISHELAHNWFGNLVTTNWWDDLWLNEGFASYIQYKGVDAVEPEWKIMTTFQTSVLHHALDYDAKLSSHPLVPTVDTPDEITAIFDVISYSKGASILRMLEDLIGEKDFKRILTRFLNLYAYKNAESQHFLKEIELSVDNVTHVMSMMKTFLKQPGYPVVNVAFDASTETYKLTQKQFLIDSDQPPNKSIMYKWTIPIKYITSEGNKSDPVFFSHDHDILIIPKPKNVSWLKFNPDQTGYYRVNYDENEWKNLIHHYSNLNVLDRTHLIEDAFSLAEAGLLSYNIVFDLNKHLVNESEYGPWKVASIKLGQIKNYLSDSESFKKYFNDLVVSTLPDIGLVATEHDDHLKKLFRITIIELACVFGNEFYLNELQKLFDTWIENTSIPISPDIRALVYKYGAINISGETWLKLVNIYKNETDANEKLKLLSGLASSNNETLLLQLLKMTDESGFIRDQDYFTLLAYMAENPNGTRLVWHYVRENWEKIVDKFSLNNRYLGQMIVAITKNFTTVEKLTEMQEFFEKYPNAGAGLTSRNIALKTVKSNIGWLSKYKQIVEESIKY